MSAKHLLYFSIRIEDLKSTCVTGNEYDNNKRYVKFYKSKTE